MTTSGRLEGKPISVRTTSTSSTSAPEQPAAAKASPPQVARATSNFATAKQEQVTLDPKATTEHVARTASPGSLWGAEAPASTNTTPSVTELASLSPTEKKQKLGELRAERDKLTQDIADRVAQLEKKWDSSVAKTQARALQEYLNNDSTLSPEQKAELQQKLNDAAKYQAEIDTLRESSQAMPSLRECTPEQIQQRLANARELRKKRAELNDTVDTASAKVDASGKKLEKLVGGEQIIDKNAPPKGSPNSLGGMVTRHTEITYKISYLEKSLKMEPSSVAQQIRADTVAIEKQFNEQQTQRRKHFTENAELAERIAKELAETVKRAQTDRA